MTHTESLRISLFSFMSFSDTLSLGNGHFKHNSPIKRVYFLSYLSAPYSRAIVIFIQMVEQLFLCSLTVKKTFWFLAPLFVESIFFPPCPHEFPPTQRHARWIGDSTLPLAVSGHDSYCAYLCLPDDGLTTFPKCFTAFCSLFCIERKLSL